MALTSLWLQVLLMSLIQHVGEGCEGTELVCVAFRVPLVEKLAVLMTSPVPISVPSMMRVKTVNAVSG